MLPFDSILLKYGCGLFSYHLYSNNEVRVWNETVANLTLMALGSSASEILLSIIELIGNNFSAGELGPGSIVGAAAFNLLSVTATCIMAIPNGETRRIKG